MNKWLKHPGCGTALALVVALMVPSDLAAVPFGSGFDDYARSAVPGYVGREALLVHCCHSHPHPPYDNYCCHPGGAAARTAAGAAVAYGTYRGVKKAAKSAKGRYKSRRR